MAGFGWGDVIDAGSRLVGSLLGYAGTKETNRSNEAINQTQIDLQREAWAREDNAIQRRMKDLEAAGLSPTLAAGSAAASSGPSISLKSKENALEKLGSAGDIYHQIRLLKQQERLNDNTIKATDKQNQKIDSEINLIDENKKGAKIQNDISEKMGYYLSQQELERYNYMKNQNMLMDIDLGIARATRADRIRNANLINHQIEEAIKHNKWQDAIGLSNLLVTSFGVGANAYNNYQRNEIWRQK